MLDSVEMSDNDTVEVTTDHNNIIIKKADNPRTYRTIQERFADFEGEYEPIVIDWGKPVGNEIW